MKWVDALKIWNSKRDRWGVPRKGTPEHAEVRAIMGQKEEPQAPSPRTSRPRTPRPRTPPLGTPARTSTVRISESGSMMRGMGGESMASSARSSGPRTPGALAGEMPASTRSSAAGPGLGGSSGSRSSGASSASSAASSVPSRDYLEQLQQKINEQYGGPINIGSNREVLRKFKHDIGYMTLLKDTHQIEGKELIRYLAKALNRGRNLDVHYGDVYLDLYTEIGASLSAYGGEAPDNLADEFYRIMKKLVDASLIKSTFNSTTYAAYNISEVEDIFPSHYIEQAMRDYNDYATDNDEEEIDDDNAEFNYGRIIIPDGDIAKMKHDSLLFEYIYRFWDAL
jgi:hypothetical protein